MEYQLFETGTVPEWTTPAWYAGRETAPHLEQPGGHRERLIAAADAIKDEFYDDDYGLTSVTDLGAGDGGLLSLLTPALTPRVRLRGYDLQQSNVDAARENRGLTVELRDVIADPVDWSGPWGAWTSCAVATEMLEHLIDPHGFVRDLPARMLVASSPCAETDRDHYEFHTWAWDHTGYAQVLHKGGFEILRHDTVLGFQVVVGVRP